MARSPELFDESQPLAAHADTNDNDHDGYDEPRSSDLSAASTTSIMFEHLSDKTLRDKTGNYSDRHDMEEMDVEDQYAWYQSHAK